MINIGWWLTLASFIFAILSPLLGLIGWWISPKDNVFTNFFDNHMTTSNGNSSNEFDNNTGEQINVVNYGSNAGTMVGKVEIDTPATFSATYTIDKQIDGKYFATVTVKSNKSTNLPNQICVIVKSDVQVTLKSPLSGDDGLIMGMSGHLGNSTCRLNPTSNMKAVFLLSDYPDTFEVYLSK